MKKTILSLVVIGAILYILVCILLYFFQEKLLFFPEKIEKDFQFSFNQKFEEKYTKSKDGIILHGILFKAESSRGLIFYLHGNGGAINSWGEVAKFYNDLGYDAFILDYRGYGKSDGEIKSQVDLFDDIECAYNDLKKEYSEDKIIVLGYSLGTGLAAHLCQTHRPKILILQAPYLSMVNMMEIKYSFIPSFILKYRLETSKYLQNCKSPIVLFHGIDDKLIPKACSETLQKETNANMILIENQGHNDMTHHPLYQEKLKQLLSP
jgi:uncharacterized protein